MAFSRIYFLIHYVFNSNSCLRYTPIYGVLFSFFLKQYQNIWKDVSNISNKKILSQLNWFKYSWPNIAGVSTVTGETKLYAQKPWKILIMLQIPD